MPKAKPAQKSAPTADTRNLTPEARRELFLAARKGEKPDYQILTKDHVDDLVPYGLITFDYVLGLGGIKRDGFVSQVHGDEGVGKSTLTYQIAKNYQEYTGEPLGVFDFEGTGTPAYLEKIGCDMDMVQFIRPFSMEDSVIKTLDLLAQGCRFFIYDSIPWMQAELDEKDIRNKKAFRASYGKHPQIMDKFFKALLPRVRRADGHVMMVNQTRTRIDDSREAEYANDYSYTNKTYTLPGGRICRFTPSTMVELRMIKEVKPYDGKDGNGPDKDPWIVEPGTEATAGHPCVNLVRARSLKNKVTGAGFREGHIWVRPATHDQPGIDNFMSIRELAREYGFIYNKGAKWLVGDPELDTVIETYPNKAAGIEDLVVNRNPQVHAKLNALLSTKIKSDTTGRHSTVVTKEEIDMIESDDAVPVGRGFDVEEAD
jgi:RecA/RadA recombinase